MSKLEKNLLLWFRQTASLLILTAVSVFAAAQSVPTNYPAKPLAFEVATIRPSPPDSTDEAWHGQGDRVTIRGYSLRQLIKAAFDLKTNAQIIGGPDWIDKQRVDISAKIADEQMSSFSKTSADRDQQTAIQSMLQTLLQERFKLQWKSVQRQLPIFALGVEAQQVVLIEAGMLSSFEELAREVAPAVGGLPGPGPTARQQRRRGRDINSRRSTFQRGRRSLL